MAFLFGPFFLRGSPFIGKFSSLTIFPRYSSPSLFYSIFFFFLISWCYHIESSSFFSGDTLYRAWTVVKLPERTELLKQLSSRLVYDDSSVPVRLAAVKAIMRILEQTLSLPSMLPVMVALKLMGTDEAIPVRVEYYACLQMAVELKMLEKEGGDAMLDADTMMLHFVERDRAYVPIIGQILDRMVWTVGDTPEAMKTFLKNSLALLLDQPAVMIKCFQTIPKTKPPKEIGEANSVGEVFWFPMLMQ